MAHRGRARRVVPLGGLAAAFVIRYDDDEPGSPWSFVVHVDERGDEEQGALWPRSSSESSGATRSCGCRGSRSRVTCFEVVASPIEIESGRSGHELRVGRRISLRATQPFETSDAVACGIPGYHEPGLEYVADELLVDDEPFSWALSGNCAFASGFDYAS